MYTLRVLNTDLKDKVPVAWHVLIKLIGLSMIGLFMPAILRFEYWLSLSMIFLFEGLFSFCILLFTYTISLKFVARWWTVTSMILWVLFFVCNYIVLYFAKSFPFILFLSPVFCGLYVSFFRSWYHVMMVMHSRGEKNFGKQNSLLESVAVIASLFWPLLGWWIADQWWTSWLYWFAIFCLLVSCIPFFFHQSNHQSIIYSPYKNLKSIPVDRSFLCATMSSFSAMWYIDFIGSIVRALILFSFLWTYTKVALVSFFSWLLLIVILYYLGKSSDEDRENRTHHWARILKWSFRSQSGTWLFATVLLVSGLLSQIFFLLIDSFHKISYKITNTWLMTLFYEHIGDKENMSHVLNSILLREIAIHWTRITWCFLLFLVVQVMQLVGQSEQWWLIFALFSVLLIAPFGMHFIVRKQKNDKTLIPL
jgi:MFS family permease